MRTTDVALSDVTATERTWPSGARVTSWIESTAPSDETQSRGRRRSRCAFRAYSIDEIGATSISPARSIRLSSVGTPVTSSTSCVSRWKTGAMLTYEMRPSRITASDPEVERDEVAVGIERRELARAEVGVVDAVARDGVQDVGLPQLVVELVDPLRPRCGSSRFRR